MPLHASSPAPRSTRRSRPARSALILVFNAILAASLACSLPGISSPTATLAPTSRQIESGPSATPAPPTPKPEPLPPALVESNPAPGAEVPLQGPVTLYFNQAMDRDSVEAAFNGAAGQFEWLDNATLAFTPNKPFEPESLVQLAIGQGAQAANGLPLPEPLALSFRASGFLEAAQRLPEPDSSDVDPTSAVLVAFNRPVVPLGVTQGSLPPAFTIQPAAEGRGDWLNTSTYAFYPQPALAGGVEYTAQLNPELAGTDGSPLAGENTWSFTTALPRLVSIEPLDGAIDVRLDADLIMTFNQPMNPESVEENFQLLEDGETAVEGEFKWNEDSTVLTFDPQSLLKRDRGYRAVVNGQALAGGGTPLGEDVESQLSTVPSLEVLSTEPGQDGFKRVQVGVTIIFNAPIEEKDVLQFIKFNPEVPNLYSFLEPDGRTLHISGNFSAETDYALSLSPNLPDAWNGRLGREFVLNFRTLPWDPELVILSGSDVIFLTPEDSSLVAQVTNLPSIDLSVGALPLEDFNTLLAPGGWELRPDYQPQDPQELTVEPDIEPNLSQPVELPLAPAGERLAPGLYFLRFNLNSEFVTDFLYAGPYILVASNIHLALKMSATDALVWAVDLRDGSPVAGEQVSIYNDQGKLIASGETGPDGIFKSETSVQEDPYAPRYAMLAQPGEERFGLALSYWDQGLLAGDIFTSYTPPRLQAYLYTDRPIYRPGQTVYFRAIARQAYNGRYSLPDRARLPVALIDPMGQEVEQFELPLSAFGTAHDSYTLPEDIATGFYRLESAEANYSGVGFQVAEYRTPEINLQAGFDVDQALAGESLAATVDARYFFDAPAGNVPVSWTLVKRPDYFYLPDYQVGPQDDSWMSPYPGGLFSGEMFVEQGEDQTDPQGILKLELSTQPEESRQTYILEVTATDESGLPVSARASLAVHPSEFYIGVRPDAWSGQAGRELGFDVRAVDWEKQSAGERELRAEFQKVIWERVEPPQGDLYSFPTYEPRYTPVGSTDFRTAPDGGARLAFTPPEAGTYQLDVSSLDPTQPGALTQVLVWVGGEGEAVWPNLPNQQLELTADRQNYQPGQSAEVFIPNPFGPGALALVTLERGVVFDYQLLELDSSGENLTVPLTAEHAPNVYLSVTLIKPMQSGPPDFRQGFLNLPVEPLEQALTVELTSEPQRTGPGGEVTFGVRVTDAAGEPVEGEFSLSVVDLAVLALADPNAEDILPAFYSNQPLGVRTGLALAAYTRRRVNFPGGLGGGGDGFAGPLVIRQDFQDTAYWNAEIITDADGRAEVSIKLPDNLTTWQVDLRGLTVDTLVGQAESQVVATKDLLVRPVTPRFLVVGDHAQMAAVVQNNTDADLQVEVGLQSTGFTLDDTAQASQQVSLPAGGRARVEWWGSAQDVESVDLVFSATSGELQDAARPSRGPLPVLRYTAPQTFGTSGMLDQGGERLELASLPRSFDPGGGSLSVELAPSLGSAMLSALDALENFPYECTEQTVSRFLPNLETYRVLQDFGIEAPDLQSRLERTLDEGLARLLATQQEDGGWSWWRTGESDAYISAYVLFGLLRARQAGVPVEEQAIQRAVDFLEKAAPRVKDEMETWELDRLAFEHFVLVQAGSGDERKVASIYQERERLSPWAQAWLAQSLEAISPGDERSQTLLSDLAAGAQRSATGVHWEDPEPGWQNMSTPIFSSAVVLYALAEHDPASPLVADALRYLMAHRGASGGAFGGASGGWASTYETAWALMALARVMQGTAELSGDFDFSATLNGAPLANGQAGSEAQLNPVTASVPISQLYPQNPNAVVIQRGEGAGRLYYRAHLQVNRPVEAVEALEAGLSVSRLYYPGPQDCPEGGASEGGCEPIREARAGDLVTVRLALTVPETAYYLLVEDAIPAGTEVLDTSLKTSQQLETFELDPSRPFADGWGWWYFQDPQVYDDRIAWAVDSLPPGTYELTYTLVILQPGEYRVLPARAWQFYFPEVQAHSAGEVFEIKE